MLGGVALFFGLIPLLVFVTADMQPKVKMIDCSIAEISPDYTTEMREQCRKLRSRTQ
jgi:hypothetical protein